jgi:hypothetical protein
LEGNLKKTDYSEIRIYRYHFNAICLCKTDLQLTAVGESIGRVVPDGHIELPMLVAAGKERREELRPKRILFCGSRDWSNVEKIVEQLKRFDPARTTIVHGAGRGADSIAAKEADEMKFTVDPFPADWDSLGKSAGPTRNKEMLESGVDEVIAFGLSKSKGGTKNTVELAQSRNIPVTVVEEN